MADDMKIQGGWFDFKIKEGTKTVNLNDELQITVLEGKKGDRLFFSYRREIKKTKRRT